MPTPVRAAFEPTASPEEIAAVIAVLEATAAVVSEPGREPAWRVAARREAIGAPS